jgi:hypothetical protein
MTPHLMKEGDLKSPIDEWFARVVCYAFSVSPQPFVQTINRATAETAQEAALSEGLAPLMEWMADFINYALQGFGFDQVEFAWMQDSAMDPQVQAQIDDLDARNGIRLRSEIRASRGLENDGTPDFIMTAQGAVLVSEIGKEGSGTGVSPVASPEGETLPEEEAPPDEPAAEGKGQTEKNQRDYAKGISPP